MTVSRAFWVEPEHRREWSPDRYLFAEYEVGEHDPSRDAAFLALRARLLMRVAPPRPEHVKRHHWVRPNPDAEFQGLLARRDPDAVRLQDLVGPFVAEESAMVNAAHGRDGHVPLWSALGSVMDARRWRHDRDAMVKARQRYADDCAARGEEPDWDRLSPAEERALRQTGRAVEALHEGGLSNDEIEYWTGQL